jgi:4-diphosphocytidyl-2-C-methyl-D-erythritol kinase
LTSELTLPSFAKINWSLHVLGKRPDGYHEVVTFLQTISLCDEIHFSVRQDQQVNLSCNDPTIPMNNTNLCVRAASLLIERTRSERGVDIRLDKTIPAGGGLGGASSNAAVTLLALANLWQLDLSSTELVNIGAELGADVPFFFFGGRALATGIGTEITPATDLPKIELIVVTPATRVSTQKAYAALKARALTRDFSAPILASSRDEAFLAESDQWPLHNDFEDVIFEIQPEIKRVQRALRDAGARRVLLAGSGSSVFGIFSSAEARNDALKKIKAESDWRVFACDSLSRGEYLRALGSRGLRSYALPIMNFNSGA